MKVVTLQGSTTGIGVIQGQILDTTPYGVPGSTTGVTKAGTGTWILSGTNTYTGPTTVNGGTLVIQSPGSMANTAITVSAGATLAVQPGSGSINLGSTYFSGAGATLTLAAGSTFDMSGDGGVGIVNLLQGPGVATGLTIGAATGAAAQLKFDIGDFTTDELNVSSGVNVLASGGVISILPAVTSGVTPGDYTLIHAAGGLGAGFTLASSTITVGGTPYNLGLNMSDPTNLVLVVSPSSPPIVWSSATGGSTYWDEPTNWTPNTAGTGPNAAGANVVFGNAGTQATVNVQAGPDPGTDVERTVGQITFNGDVATTIQNGIRLDLDNAGLAATITVNPHTVAPLTHAISTPIYLLGGLDVTVADPADQLTLSGGLDGVGPVTLTSTNLGTVLLSGPGTYSGGTAVYGGTLVVGSADALPDGSDLTVGAGAAFAAGAAASPVAVPEPGTIALLVAAAMAALAATRRRRQIAN